MYGHVPTMPSLPRSSMMLCSYSSDSLLHTPYKTDSVTISKPAKGGIDTEFLRLVAGLPTWSLTWGLCRRSG